MRKIAIVLFMVSILPAACLSKTEKDGLQAIERVYETKAGFEKGVQAAANGKTSYFKVTVNGGRYINLLAPEITAGNIAIYTYRNFNEEDKRGRAHIAVTIKQEDKETNRIFPLPAMEAPAEQAIVFENFSYNLFKKKYEEAATMIDEQFYRQDAGEKLKEFIHALEKENGAIQEYKRLGFGLRKIEQQSFFEYNGVLIFKNGKMLSYAVHAFRDPDNKRVASYSFAAKVIQ